MGDGSGSRWSRAEWVQQYDLLGKIGEGTYGLVFLARTKTPSPSKSIAIKKFKQSKDGDGVSPTAIREIMVSLLSAPFTFTFNFYFLSFLFSCSCWGRLRTRTSWSSSMSTSTTPTCRSTSPSITPNMIFTSVFRSFEGVFRPFFLLDCEIINCGVKCRRKLLGITETNSTILLISTRLSLCSGSCSMD